MADVQYDIGDRAKVVRPSCSVPKNNGINETVDHASSFPKVRWDQEGIGLQRVHRHAGTLPHSYYSDNIIGEKTGIDHNNVQEYATVPLGGNTVDDRPDIISGIQGTTSKRKGSTGSKKKKSRVDGRSPRNRDIKKSGVDCDAWSSVLRSIDNSDASTDSSQKLFEDYLVNHKFDDQSAAEVQSFKESLEMQLDTTLKMIGSACSVFNIGPFATGCASRKDSNTVHMLVCIRSLNPEIQNDISREMSFSDTSGVSPAEKSADQARCSANLSHVVIAKLREGISLIPVVAILRENENSFLFANSRFKSLRFSLSCFGCRHAPIPVLVLTRLMNTYVAYDYRVAILVCVVRSWLVTGPVGVDKFDLIVGRTSHEQNIGSLELDTFITCYVIEYLQSLGELINLHALGSGDVRRCYHLGGSFSLVGPKTSDLRGVAMSRNLDLSRLLVGVRSRLGDLTSWENVCIGLSSISINNSIRSIESNDHIKPRAPILVVDPTDESACVFSSDVSSNIISLSKLYLLPRE